MPPGEFAGISYSGDDLKTYIAEESVGYPILAMPPGSDELSKLGATPTTFVVDANGKILKSWVGAWFDPQRARIEDYFKVSLPVVVPDTRRVTAVPVNSILKH